jgi:hypothetical protein
MLQITSGKKNQPWIKVENGFPDTLDLWAEGYFQVEVTTASSSQKVQKRDLGLFLEFMREAEGTLKRERWTPRRAAVAAQPRRYRLPFIMDIVII